MDHFSLDIITVDKIADKTTDLYPDAIISFIVPKRFDSGLYYVPKVELFRKDTIFSVSGMENLGLPVYKKIPRAIFPVNAPDAIEQDIRLRFQTNNVDKGFTIPSKLNDSLKIVRINKFLHKENGKANFFIFSSDIDNDYYFNALDKNGYKIFHDADTLNKEIAKTLMGIGSAGGGCSETGKLKKCVIIFQPPKTINKIKIISYQKKDFVCVINEKIKIFYDTIYHLSTNVRPDSIQWIVNETTCGFGFVKIEQADSNFLLIFSRELENREGSVTMKAIPHKPGYFSDTSFIKFHFKPCNPEQIGKPGRFVSKKDSLKNIEAKKQRKLEAEKLEKEKKDKLEKEKKDKLEKEKKEKLEKEKKEKLEKEKKEKLEKEKKEKLEKEKKEKLEKEKKDREKVASNAESSTPCSSKDTAKLNPERRGVIKEFDSFIYMIMHTNRQKSREDYQKLAYDKINEIKPKPVFDYPTPNDNLNGFLKSLNPLDNLKKTDSLSITPKTDKCGLIIGASIKIIRK
ncbi:MAG: hypothetical protein NTX61_07215 [Bacteroidetes bacterium]|nr:hypothetical protein [Bacteroidota bacterium]